jgi:hypothetical protein
MGVYSDKILSLLKAQKTPLLGLFHQEARKYSVFIQEIQRSLYLQTPIVLRELMYVYILHMKGDYNANAFTREDSSQRV